MLAIRFAPALGALALLLATGDAHAKDSRPAHLKRGFSPRGWIMEFSPSVSLCMPTAAVKCKTDSGSTGPFLGGQFQFGFRPLRHIAIGIAYSGAALRPNWSFDVDLDNEPRQRVYAKYAQIHGVYAWGRPILGLGPVDLGAEVAFGWSTQIWKLTTPADTTMSSSGFSMYVAPVVDVFVHPHVYLGIKGSFYINPQLKVRVKGPGGTIKRDRIKNDDQLPVNQILLGLRLGVLF